MNYKNVFRFFLLAKALAGYYGKYLILGTLVRV